MEIREIQDLVDQRNKLIKSARDLNDSVLADKRDFTAEEKSKYDAIMTDEVKLRETIQRETDLRARERAEIASLTPEPSASDSEKRALDVWENYLKAEQGEASLHLPEIRALQADSPTAGGYLVPPAPLLDRLVKAVDNIAYIRKLSTVLPSGPEGLGAPALDNDPDDATWAGEIISATEDSTMSFGKRELTPHSNNKYLKVSRKLLRSKGLNAGNLVMDRLGYKQGISQEKVFLTGTGAQQPLGVFMASSKGISTSRDTTAATAVGANTAFEDVLLIDDFKSVRGALNQAYRLNAVWIMHRDVVTGVGKLKNSNGQYIWQTSVKVGEPDVFLGHPVYESEYAPSTVATASYAAILGDFSNYWIADDVAIEIQRLDEHFALTNQVAYIMRASVDGMPVMESAFQRLKLAAS